MLLSKAAQHFRLCLRPGRNGRQQAAQKSFFYHIFIVQSEATFERNATHLCLPNNPPRLRPALLCQQKTPENVVHPSPILPGEAPHPRTIPASLFLSWIVFSFFFCFFLGKYFYCSNDIKYFYFSVFISHLCWSSDDTQRRGKLSGGCEKTERKYKYSQHCHSRVICMPATN
jgi:hypothetical protein